MININSFDMYKVNFNNDYSYIDEYGDFKDGNSKWFDFMTGVQLLEYISSYSKDNDFWSFSIGNDKILIELFNPMSGECSNITIKYSVIYDTFK